MHSLVLAVNPCSRLSSPGALRAGDENAQRAKRQNKKLFRVIRSKTGRAARKSSFARSAPP